MSFLFSPGNLPTKTHSTVQVIQQRWAKKTVLARHFLRSLQHKETLELHGDSTPNGPATTRDGDSSLVVNHQDNMNDS